MYENCGESPTCKNWNVSQWKKNVLAKLFSSEPDDLAFTDGGRNRRRN